jgi:two-component system response regulator
MSHSRTILLVEDNDDDLELTLRAFEKSGVLHNMVIARDGRQALDYLFGTGAFAGRPVTLPDVVLLDLNLPKLDGLDVLRQIRADARTCYLPVVILTSSNSQQDVLRSYNLGANSFVRKPVDFARFLAAALELGVYWLDLNVNAPIPAAPPPS